jgi:two-component system, cell cycle sensor histidine kinase and response regulator CckA
VNERRSGAPRLDEPIRDANRPPPATGGGKETILLVEDEQAVRAVVRRMLEGLGYDVVETAGPAQALELLSRETTPVDLLLTDVVMPTVSGPDLAVQVRRAHPGVRVLYMSGFNDRQVDGALLRKPFSVEQLGTHVRHVLDGERRDAMLELV